MSNLEEDDGYDSIDEDAELELSCALHDLALRVKTFEENMKDRFHRTDGDDEEDEITEDIPEMDDAYSPHRHFAGSASPKRLTKSTKHHRRRLNAKAAKQQADDDGDDELYDDDDDEADEGGDDYADDEDDEKHGDPDQKRAEDDWDFQEQKEELSEMRQNIALLLQGIKAEAKALESHDDDERPVDENNQ